MTAAQYRKAIAVAVLAVVQVAAYIVADPKDLPAWVVAAAGLVNTLAVYWVRNDQPVARVEPTRLAAPVERPRRNVVDPP